MTATPASEQRLHRLLLGSAERFPDAVAHLKGSEEVTYAELALRAGRVARFLREHGMGKGDRVALVLDGCAEYLVAYYGILMAGCTVVPLNPDTRARILARAVGGCGAKAIVLGGAEVGHLQRAEGDVPTLRVALAVGPARGELTRVELLDFAGTDQAGSPLTDGGGSPEDLASICYTSGTTGRPKGVMLAHRNLVANVRSIVEYLRLSPQDRVAMVLPYFYVYGNSVLHTHVAVGGTVVHAGSMTFPVRVLERIEASRCTGLSGVPSTFATLLRVSDLGRFDLSSLRYVTQAGAAMTGSLTARLREAVPGADIFVMYGQTEASARLSFLPPEALDRKVGSAGIAIPGVSLRIVDPDGAEVPRGTVGEIVAEGDNVMLGYLDDPEATAHALRDGRLHTGDMAHMDEDGFIFIAGRKTEMIKSGGHRIGPHEIEEVIDAIPGVAECAVVGVSDEVLGEAIVAFLVLSDGAKLDEQAIKRACFAELPRYKMPSEVRFLPELPRSDRGKLLRKVLRERLEAERA